MKLSRYDLAVLALKPLKKPISLRHERLNDKALKFKYPQTPEKPSRLLLTPGWDNLAESLLE
jgi:hypothetical protein